MFMSAVLGVPGIKIGHYTDKDNITGCTVVLCEQGAVAGVDISGSAPGTRETELLRPGKLVEKIQAVILSGGSAFGLDTATGVMRYLEERGFGHETSAGKVPIVPAAIIYDLNIGNSKARPGASEGYEACLAATDGEVTEGCVGAGTGAAVGKILGIERATKSGLGIANYRIRDGIIVAALVVVNAFGDVIDPKTGEIIAAPRYPSGGFISTVEILKKGEFIKGTLPFNTIIGIVATNAQLNKEQTNRLAQVAGAGIARAVNPCHTPYDGDVLFTLSLGQKKGDFMTLAALAAEVVSAAILRGVLQAESMGGIPAARDVKR